MKVGGTKKRAVHLRGLRGAVEDEYDQKTWYACIKFSEIIKIVYSVLKDKLKK